jgi:hypothetical protein
MMERASEGDPEQERRRAFEALPAALGYIETEEMVELRRTLVEAMTAQEDTRESALRYRLMAEQLTDYDSENASRLRIGMLVSIALIKRDGGRYDAYLEDVDDALVMAEQEGIEDLVLILGEMLDEG